MLYKAEAVLLGSKLRKWALDEVSACQAGQSTSTATVNALGDT